MRPARAKASLFVIIFALLFTLSFAAFTLDNYLYLTESNTSIQQFSTTVGGTTYTVVTLAGKEILILKGDSIVKTESEIESALKGRCVDTSYPSSVDMNEVKDQVLAFDKSRENPTSFGSLETFCDKSVGQDKPNEGGCVDIVSCQMTCNQGSYSCMQYGMFSATFLPELLNYANTKRGMDTQIGKVTSIVNKIDAVTNPAQLTFNVSEELATLQNSITTLQALSTNYSSNKLFIRSQNGGFEFCIPIGFSLALNNTALTNAATKVTTLATKAACFDTLSSKTKDVFNSTYDRLSFYSGTKQKDTAQEQFDALTLQFNNLTAKSAPVASLVNDQNITDYISSINNLSATYYQNVNDKLYDQAGLTVSMIDTKLAEFDSYLNNSFVTLGSLITARSNASFTIAKASLVIESTDSALLSDLQKQRDKFASLESKVSSKISYAEIDSVSQSYNTLTTDTSALISKKKSFDAAAADNLLSGAARGMSMFVLDTIAAPLGVKESEKRAWIANIPMLVILLIDVLVLAVFTIGFFFIVWGKTEKFMKARVIKTWAMIFLFLLIVMAGFSIALNSIINKETGPVSLYNFMLQTKKYDSVVLFLERSSTANAAPMNSCAAQFETLLTSIGKTVTKIDVVDGVCNDKIISECLTQVGKTPIIRLKYAAKNATTFYTFYKIEAVLEGDDAYFNDCPVKYMEME